MISRSAEFGRDSAALLISIVSLGGSHRAIVDLSLGLTTIRKRAAPAYFHSFASDAKSVGPTFAIRLRRMLSSAGDRDFRFCTATGLASHSCMFEELWAELPGAQVPP